MAPLLNSESISKSYGSKTLFQNISFSLFQGDKVGLIGPNGSGKSTLLKILCNLESPDSGQVTTQKDLRVGYVPQASTYTKNTPEEVLLATLLANDDLDEHERYTQARIALGKAGFQKHDIAIETLSGGWKKRLDIANALVLNPDVLLLDEPTNHLDIEGIIRLEKFLQRINLPFIITSHDRQFLETVASRMVEVNMCYPKGVFATEGSYSTFLEQREIFLQGQQQYQNSLASKVRREIEWLRQTPQARTTKSRSRIQNANSLIQELSDVKSRNTSSKSQIDFSSTGKQSKKLLAVKNIGKTLQGKCLFSGLTFTLSPGSRVAIVGDNGCGKTTLLKVLAGELSADSGTVKEAENLSVVYFDQHKEKLPEEISVKEAFSPTGETIQFQGRSIHVSAWAKRFLFTPAQLELPVSQLSGGEKARILIARLMAKPADIIFLDEPSNDLDITTLEILEESLRTFPGAVVFITHDRYMLSDLATLLIGLGHGPDRAFFADYYEWERYHDEQKKIASAPVKKGPRIRSSQKRMTYQEKRELESIEEKILMAEEKVEETQKLLDDPKLSDNSDKLQDVCLKLKDAQESLETLYARWQELENKRADP